jgi:RNA polymerase sigma factor (sigma-70 family)
MTDPSWSQIVDRIRTGDPSGMEELYTVFRKGIRFYLCRQLGPQDLDDRVHEAFLIITQAIRKGSVREPERLMGFVRTVVRRQVACHIEQAVEARRHHADADFAMKLSDRCPNPERAAIERQTNEVAMRVLNSIGRRDREVLVRFYLREQSPREICLDLDLTETQFRLIKSRAKARFGELGRRRFSMHHVATHNAA